MIKGIRDLAQLLLDGEIVELMQKIDPELFKLLTEFETLDNYTAGELIGRLALRYGQNFLSGAGAAGPVKKFLDLKKKLPEKVVKAIEAP